MKSIFIIIILIFSGSAKSQNRFYIAPLAGYNLFHSENDDLITEKKDWGVNYGFLIARDIKIGKLPLLLELSYIHNEVSKNIEIPNLITKSKMTHNVYPFDISWHFRSYEFISGGLSMALSNRRTEFTIETTETNNIKVDDRASSLGIGAHVVLFYRREHFFFNRFVYFLDTRLRYIRGIVNYGRSRDLSGYHLDFLTLQTALGILF